MKKTLFFAMMLAAAVHAGSILVCDKASEGKSTFTLNSYAYKPQVVTENGETFFRVRGRVALVSDATAKIDPNKYYVVSVKIRSVANPSKALLGYSPLDSQNRSVEHINAVAVAKSFTKLTRDAKTGDKSIFIENGQNWVKGACAPVFNAKEDNSDIPNFNVLPPVRQIKENDNDFEVELGAALKQDLPAGTFVREHRMGGFVYDVTNPALTTQWALWKSGKPRKGDAFRKGATQIRPVIICNLGFPNESLDFDELKIEEFDTQEMK